MRNFSEALPSETIDDGETARTRGEDLSQEHLWTKDFVLVCLATLAFAFGGQFLMPTLPLYMKSFGGQDADIGLIFGVYSISALVTRIFAGRALDLWGRKWLFVGGSFLFFVGMPLYFFTTTVPSIVLLRLFHGMGLGIVTTANGVLVADLAPAHRRGEAVGFFGLSQSVAQALGPGIALWLVTAQGLPLNGFSMLFATCTAFTALELLAALFIGETRRPPEGQPVSGSAGIASLFSRDAVPFTVTMGFGAFAVGAVISFAPIYLSTDSTGTVSVFFFVYAFVMAASRPLVGMLSDRINRRVIVIPLMVFCAIGISILGLSPTLPVAVAAAIVFGLGFGSLNPTLLALVVDVVKPQDRGAALATFMSSMDIGIAAGSMTLGLVAQAAGYRPVFPLGGVACLLGLVYFLLYRRSLSRAKAVVAAKTAR